MVITPYVGRTWTTGERYPITITCIDYSGANPVYSVDFFFSEQSVVVHVRKMGRSHLTRDDCTWVYTKEIPESPSGFRYAGGISSFALFDDGTCKIYS